MAMVLEKTAVETPKRPTKRWVITKAFTDQNALNPANEAIRHFATELGFHCLDCPDDMLNWSDALTIQAGDVVYLAYPTFYLSIETDGEYEVNIIEALHMRGARVVLLVGDSLILREKAACSQSELNALNSADILVVPNNKMRDQFTNMGVTTPMLHQGLYPIKPTHDMPPLTTFNRDKVFYTGNLAKGPFLKTIQQDALAVEVFGPNAAPEVIANQSIRYHGALSHHDLAQKLTTETGFGLIWDGDSLPMLSQLGRYTQYNYPYKSSFYLSLGMPLIAWRGSAVADVITQYRCGIVLNRIEELGTTVKALTTQQVNRMVENARNLGEELRTGRHFMRVLAHAELFETED
ncbi:glycosyltransferase [Streptococcus pneumoniae]|nr:glycosyltransferase [Streptococcus pneumoniae]